jgi:hypothetical protein
VCLSADPSAPTPVVARLPYGQVRVAETFGEFLARYVLDDQTVLFPSFAVVADETGIGSEDEGRIFYVVRWSDVQQIEVQVVGAHDEPGEPVFIWVVSGRPGTKTFVAPVDTVAGGHIVRATIRSLPGFDEPAFAAARETESRGEAGTFVVWRAEGPPEDKNAPPETGREGLQ